MQKITVAISGGFDPIHIGHVRLINEAKELGDRLVVIANNDNWLKQKKGYAFMPEQDRVEILRNLRAVDDVLLTKHPKNPGDMSVCEELISLRPDIFANGGDRKQDNIPEYKVCQDLHIKLAFNIGGEKIRSSSELVTETARKKSMVAEGKQ